MTDHDVTLPEATLSDIRALLEAERQARSEAIANGPPADLEAEVSENLVATWQQSLAEVEATIARIDAGTYGMCETCGKAISPARLEALPTTARCVECAVLPASLMG